MRAARAGVMTALAAIVPWGAAAADIAPQTVALAAATPDQIERAFIFVSVAMFPGAELIWVQHTAFRGGAGGGELIDRSGRWLRPAEFGNPNFAGDARDGLFPATDASHLYGYIDARGEWVITPRFQGAEPFANGRAAVHTGPGERRVIDTQGRIIDAIDTHQTTHQTARQVVPADGQALEWIQPAVNGLSAAGRRGKAGLLDAAGQWRLPPGFDTVAVNSDGTLLAMRDGRTVFFDRELKERPASRSYRTTGAASDGLTPACQGHRCGYVGAAGEWSIPPRFEQAFEFSGGAAKVMLNGLLAYIDRSGQLVTPEPPNQAAARWLWRPPAIRDADTNNGGTAFGYIDRSGALVIPAVFANAGDFGQGRAPVQGPNDAYGYIDAQGRWVLPPVYRPASAFVEGLALVNGCGPYRSVHCYIDTQGREQVALPPDVESAGSFERGVAWTRAYSGTMRWVDRSGKTAAPPGAPASSPALRRLSVNGGRWGYADANDRFVIAPRFDDVGDFAQDLAPVKIGDKWGYVHRSGKIAVTPAHDEVGAFSEGYARVRDGERWGYIDMQGRALKTLAFTAAADFHDGLARVGIELEAAKRLAAGVAADAKEVPDFRPGWPVMLGDGSSMQGGIAFVKRVRGHTYAGDWFALMNAKGELIIPPPAPVR